MLPFIHPFFFLYTDYHAKELTYNIHRVDQDCQLLQWTASVRTVPPLT